MSEVSDRLRDYQKDCVDQVFAEWQKVKSVLLFLATGGGKTFTFCEIIQLFNVPTVAMAHRSELVGQMSMSLSEMGIEHRIIASEKAVTEIMKAQHLVYGRTFYNPCAPVICASVDTLVRRELPEASRIKLVVIDEGHHALTHNKWGKCLKQFTNAFALGVTATPVRADGQGLGTHAAGVYESIVEGPTGDELIEMGYLSPYRFLTPKVSDIDYSEVQIGATGDYKMPQLRAATKGSRQLVGSMVQTYADHTWGKKGLTFCVDVEHAEETEHQYQQAGVPTKLVTGTTSFLERVRSIEKFRKGELWQLVNVDLFGEGFDVPDAEVITMGRKTNSFPLYSQMIGRVMRPVYADGFDLTSVEGRRAAIAAGPKPHALVIDHVKNLQQHLIPTANRHWTLDSREKRGGKKLDTEDKIKSCGSPTCAMPYRAILTKCPFCGWQPEPVERAKPEEVDGDLYLVDPEMMAELRKETERIMDPARTPVNKPQPVILSILKKHGARMEAQEALRGVMSQWAGYRKQDGLGIREVQKLFYLRFGMDVMSAQTLGTTEAEKLRERVQDDFGNMVQGLEHPIGSGV